MPQLPEMTPEARAANLEKAAAARTARADVKRRLKAGTATLADVLAEAASDQVIARIRVVSLLESLPGVGKVRARQAMELIGIRENRRAGGLGSNQRDALEREFAPVPA
jgi:S13-like protein